MACGVPVVAADTPAFREVVGDAGLLVEAGSPEQAAEALCQVVASGETCVDGTRDKRAVLVARGLRRARRFTWEACARQTMQVYREAVEAWQ
jgi:alpha-1,3-rhamnosyl/mannosyltransferase